MTENGFVIRFKGDVADRHEIGMRHLGQSLIGFEGIISIGLIALTTNRLPKRGERFPLVVRAQEPRISSFEIPGDLVHAAWILPLVQQAVVDGASDIVWRWISWVLLRMGGRVQEADQHFTALIKLTENLNASHERREVRQQQFLLEVLDRTRHYATQAVAPVGPECNTVHIISPTGESHETVIDVPVADAVRSKHKLEVGDMLEMRVHVDGIIHHNKQLKVEHPEESGTYITAQVRDPLFSEVPNVYAEAAASRGWLDVTAKPSYRDGKLYGLYIMDAKLAESGD